jgi:hypothetical protein
MTKSSDNAPSQKQIALQKGRDERELKRAAAAEIRCNAYQECPPQHIKDMIEHAAKSKQPHGMWFKSRSQAAQKLAQDINKNLETYVKVDDKKVVVNTTVISEALADALETQIRECGMAVESNEKKITAPYPLTLSDALAAYSQVTDAFPGAFLDNDDIPLIKDRNMMRALIRKMVSNAEPKIKEAAAKSTDEVTTILIEVADQILNLMFTIDTKLYMSLQEMQSSK